MGRGTGPGPWRCVVGTGSQAGHPVRGTDVVRSAYRRVRTLRLSVQVLHLPTSPPPLRRRSLLVPHPVDGRTRMSRLTVDEPYQP